MKFFNFFQDSRNPAKWNDEDVVTGKLYRFVETGIELPLIEINQSEIYKLEGYEYFEPDWVVAEPPTLFAIYDREEHLISGPQGMAPDYSLPELLNAEGYASIREFCDEFDHTLSAGKLTDLDVWIRLGLPAKVFVPSLKRKARDA
jgi:hypothetical protein